MKSARLFVSLGLLFSSLLCAASSSATIEVFGISAQKVVIAADSRALIAGEDDPPNDHACKVIGLGRKMIFTGAGISGMEYIHANRDWDVFTQARKAYRLAPHSNVESVSTTWIKLMQPKYLAMIRTHRKQLLDRPGNNLFNAVFVGVDETGALAGRQITFTYDPAAERDGVFKPYVSIDVWSFADKTVFKVIGHGEIAYEFASQSTLRARAEAAHFQAELLLHPGGDTDLRQAVHYIQLTEGLAPFDWGVGGPIDQVEILPGSGVHWIQRKPECH